ncbi:hypothetical protein M8C21_027367, partial [Ambrosia artemisiifolia]
QSSLPYKTHTTSYQSSLTSNFPRIQNFGGLLHIPLLIRFSIPTLRHTAVPSKRTPSHLIDLAEYVPGLLHFFLVNCKMDRPSKSFVPKLKMELWEAAKVTSKTGRAN